MIRLLALIAALLVTAPAFAQPLPPGAIVPFIPAICIS